MKFVHKSVLLHESIDWLLTDPAGIYVDCTLGGAGHAAALAAGLAPTGVLIGIDQDEDALAAAKERLAKTSCQVRLVQGNFKDLKSILAAQSLTKVNGIFFDLGVSSYQLDTPERGFSYMHDGPLDMRMNKEGSLTAFQVVNTYSEGQLNEIISAYGEERWSKRIAQFIVAARAKKKIMTTFELVTIIKEAIPKGARQSGPHPAKRTFQAIRIEVNNELGILAQAVDDAVHSLNSGGRIGVITFQSLEDRIVKKTLAGLYKGCICPPGLPCVCGRKREITKPGDLVPQPEEISANPRARSARLRFAEKL